MYIYKGQYPRYPNSPSAEPSNSFVCLPLPSYVFLKNLSELQFIRMLSKSFVYLPLLSYVFLKNLSDLQFIRMSSTSFICLPKKIWTPIYLYVVQVFRMSSTFRMSSSKIFLNSNSFVSRPSLSYVFQFIRMSSKNKFWTLIHSYAFQVLSMSSSIF